MIIKSVNIKNFRCFENLEIDNFSSNVQVIGNNNSGKTTLFHAILKVLNPHERQKNLTLEDAFKNNAKDIVINIKIDASDIIDKGEKEQLKFRNSFPDMDFNHIINIEMTSKFDSSDDIYIDTFIINGDERERNEYRSLSLSIDKYLEVLYIDPKYNLEDSFKNLISAKKKYYSENNIPHNTDKINKAIKLLNKEIKNNEQILEISNDINNQMTNNIFKNSNMDIISNVDVDNIYKSLTLLEVSGTDNITSSGDGKKKILSNNLNISAKNILKKEKDILILMEEPETHLFINNQKQYLKEIEGIEKVYSQLFITTHSPHIVNFMKDYSIVKLFENNLYKKTNILDNDFGYFYSTKMSEMFYYDKILLVEGYSEEIFYDYITFKLNSFLKQIISNKIGIFNIKGIGFKKYIQTFQELGIEVYIKTDNDLFTNSIKKDYYSFSGLNRALSYLNTHEIEKNIEFLSNILDHNNKIKIHLLKSGIDELKYKDRHVDNIGEYLVDEKFQKINKSQIVILELKKLLNILNSKNIYVSSSFVGFEGELQNLFNIDEENIISLKKKKAVNLYKYLNEELRDKINNDILYKGSDINKLFSFLEKKDDK